MLFSGKIWHWQLVSESQIQVIRPTAQTGHRSLVHSRPTIAARSGDINSLLPKLRLGFTVTMLIIINGKNYRKANF